MSDERKSTGSGIDHYFRKHGGTERRPNAPTNGKGDIRRPEDPGVFRKNYDSIDWSK